MAGCVVLVCGPPCSGKTTYVQQHRQPGDLVGDFDVFARQAGSPTVHRHDVVYRDAAGARLRALEAQAARGEHDGTVWIIRWAPGARQRAAMAARLHAEVVLLDPGQAECVRPAHAGGWPRVTEHAIWQWARREARG